MGDITGKGHHTNPLTPKSHRFTRTAGMGLCHSTRDRARRRRGQNDYSSLAYTAYRNTQKLQWDPRPRTLHAAHVTVLTSGIGCCHKWSGRRADTGQSLGVFDTTLISGNEDKIGSFFFSFFFFPFFLFFPRQIFKLLVLQAGLSFWPPWRHFPGAGLAAVHHDTWTVQVI